MATFPFELVSPERLLISESAEAVVAPGIEGEFTVMAGHAPFVAVLKPGILVVKIGDTLRRLFVRGGLAEVTPEQGLTILADRAIPVEDMDPAQIEAEIRNAEEDLADAADDEARRRARQQLDQLTEVRAILGQAPATPH